MSRPAGPAGQLKRGHFGGDGSVAQLGCDPHVSVDPGLAQPGQPDVLFRVQLAAAAFQLADQHPVLAGDEQVVAAVSQFLAQRARNGALVWWSSLLAGQSNRGSSPFLLPPGWCGRQIVVAT